MQVKYISWAFYLIIGFVCLSFSTLAQMKVTASYYKNRVDSLAHTYANNIQLVYVSGSDIDTTGKSYIWRYIFDRLDSLKLYYFTGQNNQVKLDSIGNRMLGYGTIVKQWIDSDSAFSIADRSGGAIIRKRFPSCIITATLCWDDLPTQLTRWWIFYKCIDSNKVISLNAANGIIVSVKSIDDKRELDHFTLYQNYPNPFNPTTNISFTLLRALFVTLKIFDITGREITTIINKEMPAGNHNFQWNAMNESSGIYFYRVEAGSTIQTKKLIVLR